MNPDPDWLAQEFKFWGGDSAELHALMDEVSEDIDQALCRQAIPMTEDELIRAGAAFIVGGDK